MTKIAIIHDWLYINGGAEKVLEQLLLVYPNADVYSLVNFLPEKDKGFLHNKHVQTSFIQKMPFAKKKFRNYFPLMPFAIEQFDLSGYDIIISSSYAMAKGVLTHAEQLHVCYCHSPVRYAWDLYHQYIKEANLKTKTPKGFIAKLALHYLRLWDVASANKVDYFIANSNFIAKRIRRVYHRLSTTIYPPVDIDSFQLQEKKKEYYVTASRLVSYKRIDLIIDAFKEMPEKELFVIGSGPDFEKLNAKKSTNINLLGYQSFSVLIEYMQNAKAFVFAANEDFGITPVEAMACGTPVVAYGNGGSLETVIENKTGVFFYEQSKESIIEAIGTLDLIYPSLDFRYIRENAERFNQERFRQEIKDFIDKAYKKFSSK